MSNKNKNLKGVVYSTNPGFQYQREDRLEPRTLLNEKQQLRIRIEKQHRGGKTVTVVDGFIGKEEDLQVLGKMLKTRFGVGGSVKEGLILLQGDLRERVLKLLIESGYKAK